ncbi:MAG: hypothetical protein M1156_02170 [Candidatus Marsarchaeota archaeon]|jgi:NAD+ kinase|nr:hypothetical protein [Candidatus Marsarchaeota archaeon]
MKISIFAKRNYKELKKLRSAFDIVKDGDIALAVGGDGTFLKAARTTDKPILAIRDSESGSVGYHSDVSLKDIDMLIGKLKRMEYYIETAGRKLEILYRKKRHYAVNEALLINALGEVSFRLYEIKDGTRRELYPYIMSGDGIIMAGAIGSTAYNRSAGGPIILSDKVVCLTFINADGPYQNPLVMDINSEVEISIEKYNANLRYDGINIALLKPGDKFRIKCSDRELKLVRFRGKEEDFSSKLRRIIESRME